GHAPLVHWVLLLDDLVASRPQRQFHRFPPAARSDGGLQTRPIPRTRRIQPAFPRAACARIPCSPLPVWRYSLPSPISSNASVAGIARAGNGREGLRSWLPRWRAARSLAPVRPLARAPGLRAGPGARGYQWPAGLPRTREPGRGFYGFDALPGTRP